MQESGRYLVGLLAVVAGFTQPFALYSWAQTYPAKPIRIMVGVAPGGSTDVTARLVGQKLSDQLGQPVIVENRTGASGAISAERVAASPADGYTLMAASAGDAVLPALRSSLPYDLQRDLAPIARIAIAPYVLVTHPSLPARNVKELIALARAQPGKLNYGSTGISGAFLAGALFNQMAQVTIMPVPYKGGAEAAIANVAGQIEMNYPTITAALPFLPSGKLRAIAVTSIKRSSLLPSTPTVDESGLAGYDRSGWMGLLAPARVPRDIITRLNAVIRNAVSGGELKDLLNKQGLEPLINTPEEFAVFIQREIEQNIKLIKLTGVKAE